MADDVSKSWFCTFANPEQHGFDYKPDEIVDKMIEVWIEGNPQRTCAVVYCISAEGLKHCHAVFEDTKAMRWTAVQKLFPGMHIEPTKGNKDQAEDYINKRGKWEEKGEIIDYTNRHGEIKGSQGQRNDLEIIEELLSQGNTPNEIMAMSLSYRRYEKLIRDAYFQKRFSETPIKRDIDVYWHVGKSRTGKSHEIVKLTEKHKDESIYIVTDYEHGFDKYNGEPILFMDEFRGQMRFALLLTLLDGYRVQIPCRYSNAVSLWNEVHITSVLPPELVYQNMVKDYRTEDTLEQLILRLKAIIYHYKEGEEYRTLGVAAEDYRGYESLKNWAKGYPYGFTEVSENTEELPFTKPYLWGV